MAPIVRSLLLIIPAAIGFVLMLPALAEVNTLLSGETLDTTQELSSGESQFIIQSDCNLVLYNRREGFQSDTSGHGKACVLTLTRKGELIVTNENGQTVWISPKSGPEGNYAAVLRPDGVTAIYGPEVWSTPTLSSVSTAGVDESLALENSAMAQNLMFSGQSLFGDTKLRTKEYTFEIPVCDLLLTRSGNTVWETGKFLGNTCFARVNHEGQLSVVTDDYKVIFTTEKKASGEYVLILQKNGQAVIYGPILWSTQKS